MPGHQLNIIAKNIIFIGMHIQKVYCVVVDAANAAKKKLEIDSEKHINNTYQMY